MSTDEHIDTEAGQHLPLAIVTNSNKWANKISFDKIKIDYKHIL